MNELRPLSGDGECVSLNAPTARCLLLLLQNSGKVISRDEFWLLFGKPGEWWCHKIRSIKISLCCENHCSKRGCRRISLSPSGKKGLSVAPDTLIIPLSDEECENMNRATLTHYQNNKVADVTAESKGYSDDHVVIPLTEKLAIQGNELIENKVEIPGKQSERLQVTFKMPTWLIALIVVMIVINIVVLVVLHR